MSNTSYINSSGRKVLEYVTPDTIVLDLSFIMTLGKRLTINMPYMKLEKKVSGNDIKAVRLLDFRDEDEFVYLDVQELVNGKTYSISWSLEYEGEHWLWSLTDVYTLVNAPR